LLLVRQSTIIRKALFLLILFCSIGIACIYRSFSTPLHAGRDNMSSLPLPWFSWHNRGSSCSYVATFVFLWSGYFFYWFSSCWGLGGKSRLTQTMLQPIYAFLSFLYDFFCGRRYAVLAELISILIRSLMSFFSLV
jgi:hypothetical protein